MAQAVLVVEGLAGSPLDAAADFHRVWLPLAREASQSGDLVLVFPSADHEHRGWRLAAVQELAREASPRRVNGLAGSDANAIDQATAWLASAPGVTGQLLVV
jgi:hypothetical protein